MFRKKAALFVNILLLLVSLFISSEALAYVKGIYITSGTARSAKKMDHLICRSKAAGINTFVIDVYGRNRRFAKNISKVLHSRIHFVARIVMFPYGAKGGQMMNKKIWESRWRCAQYAISLGAKEIQLDYIRYHKNTPASVSNEQRVHKVIQFFRHRLKGTGVKLQIDIFGVVAHRPTRTIGQNVVLFANSLDAINPMVYPSHYEPFRHHAVRPYETVFDSVSALRHQLSGHPRVKIYAYIELFNYRYPMNYQTKIAYIKSQIQGAMNGGANGWYAWSANNHYKILFNMLDYQGRRRRGR